MGSPPVDSGACHDTVTAPAPARPVTSRGGVGACGGTKRQATAWVVPALVCADPTTTRWSTAVASLVVPYSPEHRALAANEGLLRDLATLTGGALPTTPAQVFKEHRRQARVRVDAWPYLLGLALLLFLPDVALRRFGSRGTASGGWLQASAAGASTVPMAERFGSRRRR